jgi:hypothetical protein
MHLPSLMVEKIDSPHNRAEDMSWFSASAGFEKMNAKA